MYYKITITPHNHPNKHKSTICQANDDELSLVMKNITTKLLAAYEGIVTKTEHTCTPNTISMYNGDDVLLITIHVEWVD